MIELREYQQDLYQKTVNAFRQGNKRVLVTVGCGAGKSYIFAELIRRTKGEALILTHRKELKRQHEELLRKKGYYHDLYSKQFAEESQAKILH